MAECVDALLDIVSREIIKETYAIEKQQEEKRLEKEIEKLEQLAKQENDR